MKFSLAIVSALLTIVCAAPQDTQLLGCPHRANARPFYRAYNSAVSDHFYTLNAAEIQAAAGYTSEGVVGYIFPYYVPGTIPLYRMFSASATDHFYTTNVTEMNEAVKIGYKSEGVAGYVLRGGAGCGVGCGNVPLFRLFSAGGQDHFYTTSSAERDQAIRSGYDSQGIAWVYPA